MTTRPLNPCISPYLGATRTKTRRTNVAHDSLSINTLGIGVSHRFFDALARTVCHHWLDADLAFTLTQRHMA